MNRVERYEENVYSNEYYLLQYIIARVCLRKKYCYMLLTKEEYNMLKEYLPDITINELYTVPQSEYVSYEIYKN